MIKLMDNISSEATAVNEGYRMNGCEKLDI
jgi:hypothetical protein